MHLCELQSVFCVFLSAVEPSWISSKCTRWYDQKETYLHIRVNLEIFWIVSFAPFTTIHTVCCINLELSLFSFYILGGWPQFHEPYPSYFWGYWFETDFVCNSSKDTRSCIEAFFVSNCLVKCVFFRRNWFAVKLNLFYFICFDSSN